MEAFLIFFFSFPVQSNPELYDSKASYERRTGFPGMTVVSLVHSMGLGVITRLDLTFACERGKSGTEFFSSSVCTGRRRPGPAGRDILCVASHSSFAPEMPAATGTRARRFI